VVEGAGTLQVALGVQMTEWLLMRKLILILLLLASAGLVLATTLERMTVETMVEKSTSIVRGTVIDTTTVQSGRMIYTVYKVKIAEMVKGAKPGATVEVYVPGGVYGREKLSIAGSPVLSAGSEYVVFLWLSPRGVNQVIGLGQGVFDVKTESGTKMLSRGPVDATFVTSNGAPAEDHGMRLSLSSLRSKAKVEVQ